MTSSQLYEATDEAFNYMELILSYVSKAALLCGAVVVAVLLRWSVIGHGGLVPCFQVHGTLSANCYYLRGGVA